MNRKQLNEFWPVQLGVGLYGAYQGAKHLPSLGSEKSDAIAKTIIPPGKPPEKKSDTKPTPMPEPNPDSKTPNTDKFMNKITTKSIDLYNKAIKKTSDTYNDAEFATKEKVKDTFLRPAVSAGIQAASAPLTGAALASGAYNLAKWGAKKTAAGAAIGGAKMVLKGTKAGGNLIKDLAVKGYNKIKGYKQPELTKNNDIQKTYRNIDEQFLAEARIKIIKARIRGGKIQRRKKVSNVPGMTLRGGKLKRMSPTERRNRRMGQKRGKIKRRSKLARTLQKRKRSLQKRKTLGIR